MSKRVSQLEIFLAGFRTDSDNAAAGYIVKFFTADQTYATPKNAWTTKDKDATITSVTLDSNGRYATGAYFAGGEVYDLRLYESDGTTVVRSYANVKVPETTTSITTVSAATYAATVDDDVIICNTASNAITINGVAVASAVKSLTIINIGTAGNDVTFDPNGSELVDGASTAVLADSVATVYYPDSTASQWRGQGVSSGTSGLLLDVEVFTASGTWTKPSGTNTVEVEVVGGGGGGGGVAAGANRSGGGGGGGGYSYANVVSGISATETVTVGAGGAGGAGAGAAVAGGTSSFGAHVIANGGGAGGAGDGSTTYGVDGSSGDGATISGAVGDITQAGEQGLDGMVIGTSFIRVGVGGSAPNGGQRDTIAIYDMIEHGTAFGQDGNAANSNGGGGSAGFNGSPTLERDGGAGRAGYVLVRSYS